MYPNTIYTIHIIFEYYPNIKCIESKRLIFFFQKNCGDNDGDDPKDKDWELPNGIEPSDDYDDDNNEQHLFQTPAIPNIPTVPQLNLHLQHGFEMDL